MFSIFAPPQTLLVVVLAGAAVLWLVVSTLVSYRKLQHIPGPWLARFSQLWMLNVTLKGDLYLAMEEVIQKYGTTWKRTSRAGILSSTRFSCKDRT